MLLPLTIKRPRLLLATIIVFLLCGWPWMSSTLASPDQPPPHYTIATAEPQCNAEPANADGQALDVTEGVYTIQEFNETASPPFQNFGTAEVKANQTLHLEVSPDGSHGVRGWLCQSIADAYVNAANMGHAFAIEARDRNVEVSANGHRILISRVGLPTTGCIAGALNTPIESTIYDMIVLDGHLTVDDYIDFNLTGEHTHHFFYVQASLANPVILINDPLFGQLGWLCADADSAWQNAINKSVQHELADPSHESFGPDGLEAVLNFAEVPSGCSQVPLDQPGRRVIVQGGSLVTYEEIVIDKQPTQRYYAAIYPTADTLFLVYSVEGHTVSALPCADKDSAWAQTSINAFAHHSDHRGDKTYLHGQLIRDNFDPLVRR